MCHCSFFFVFFFFLMIRRPPRSTLSSSSAASDVYKRQVLDLALVVDRPSIDRADGSVNAASADEEIFPSLAEGLSFGCEIEAARPRKGCGEPAISCATVNPVSYTHLRAHETPEHLVCRLLLEKKKKKYTYKKT
eukprot:TRINITY_DN4608_c0_g2_i3.p1 TRINITY_DN4608_c0_g2~~TRINITY_DN4608_c0_g2_i3.p1  ORF type:complete len:135 (+),score=50.13 TRINITY_DN4608_c0_g2_i3:76-480(+)